MSIINKDQESVNNPRRNKLEGVAVPLRDRVVKKLYNKLVDLNFGQRITEAWHVESANLAPALERQQVYLKDIDSWAPADAEAPFSGSSNLHLPTAFIVCKTYHARFMQALMGVDPPFSAKARREDGVDTIEVIEDFMRFTLTDWMNFGEGCEEVVDQWLWRWVTTGTGILKHRWHIEYSKYVDVQAQPEAGPPQFSVDESGREVAQPTVVLRDKEVPVVTTKFKGPVVELVDLEDIRMVGGSNPDTCDIIMQRTWYTASELWQLVDQKMVDEEVVEEIIKAGKQYKTGNDQTSIKQQRAQIAGKASVDSEVELDRYEILEGIAKVDVDESGITSDVVVWVHSATSKILRASYLQRLIPSGQRPFTIIHFHKRPGEQYGVGLPEIMHPLTVELDAMHNMRIDWGMITNMPFFFYRASSSLDPEILRLEPGAGIPVDNPQTDVYFPPIQNKTAFGAQEEQAVQSYIERLTGISDLSLGVMSGTQGATRTASGVRAILGESNSNLDVHLRRMNRGWRKFLKLTYEMLRNRADPALVFSVTGKDGKQVFRQIFNPQILPDVDFEISSNSANSNKAIQVETAQQLVQITTNPLHIQLGICGPKEAYNALRNYLAAINVPDLHRYIVPPQGPSYLLTPEEEFNRVVRGQDVQVQPQSDHAGFIAFAQQMIDAQEEAATLSDGQIQMLQAQMQRHADMQRALEQQAAQVAAQQQMMLNTQAAGAPAALGNPVAGNAGLPPVAE